MFKYEIEFPSEENGILVTSCVQFKSIDLAVSHLISAMDCGKIILFRPIFDKKNEN